MRRSLTRHFCIVQEQVTERAQPVIGVHHNHIAGQRQRLPIVQDQRWTGIGKNFALNRGIHWGNSFGTMILPFTNKQTNKPSIIETAAKEPDHHCQIPGKDKKQTNSQIFSFASSSSPSLPPNFASAGAQMFMYRQSSSTAVFAFHISEPQKDSLYLHVFKQTKIQKNSCCFACCCFPRPNVIPVLCDPND